MKIPQGWKEPQIIEDFIQRGHPNRPGIVLIGPVDYVVHYTANFKPSADDSMHQRYMGRPYDVGDYIYFDSKTGERKVGHGPIEAGSAKGKQYGTKFLCAGAQVFADMNSVTLMMPVLGAPEVAWHAGDRQLPYDQGYKGQRPLAKQFYDNRQNYMTIGVEICCNDKIPNSTLDWDLAVFNAQYFLAWHMLQRGRRPDQVRIWRHWDLTAKNCPAPFIKEPAQWDAFRSGVSELYRTGEKIR